MHTSETLESALARYGRLIFEATNRVLDAQDTPKDFYGIMRYHLGWANERLEPISSIGGKGLRGALLLLMYEALGGNAAAAAPCGVGIELLHNFSLIHDDFEDSSLTRRHRATVWSVWGAPLGINVGDGLYALAHLAFFDSPLQQQAPERFIAILHEFDKAALRVCEGQHLDMTFESAVDISADDYLRMIGGKAATLIAAAAAIGAHAAVAPQQCVELAYQFGYELGMAFQMQDDILGIWGNEAATGKSASSDIASRKKTLPVLLAMEHAPADARERLHALYAQPSGDETDTTAILDALERADARALAEDCMRHYWASARQALQQMSLPPATTKRVEEFARLFIERTA